MDYSGRNIKDIIAGEDFNYKQIVKFLHQENRYFQMFVDYSITNNINAWRCSWIIFHYLCEYGIDEIQEYSNQYVNSISNIKKDGQIRENLKILSKLNLDENQIGELYDFCLELLWNNKLQPSVRVVAFRFMLKVANQYPELRNEIFQVAAQIKDHLSEGIKRSVENEIKKYNYKIN